MSVLVISRGAIAAACRILEGHFKANADFESFIVEYGLLDPPFGTIKDKANALLLSATSDPARDVETDFGSKPISRLLVEEAILRGSNRTEEHLEKMGRYLNVDGFSIVGGKLELTYPNFAKIPEAKDEVETLLEKHGFVGALNNLTQAKSAQSRGEWESANGQIRTFFEDLTNSIADKLFPTESGAKTSGQPKRQLLRDKGFLSKDKHEFDDSGQNFIPGLAKLLHPDGAHPGLSDEDHSVFRMQVVLVTARLLLRRFETFGGANP